MLCAGGMAGSLLIAAPAAPAGRGGTRGVHSAASRTECCFVLTVRASGRISADFGQDYTTQQRIGSESYTWEWGTRELLEYTEFAGRPSLERPLNRRFQPTPSLRQAGTWHAESNEAVVYDHTKMPAVEPCLHVTSIPARIMDTQFNDVTRLRDTGLEVRARFAGHKFVIRLLGDANELPFVAPCLDTHVVGQLEAPPLPNGEPDDQ